MNDVRPRTAVVADQRRSSGWDPPDLARDIDAGAYLETMLVAAVASVLLTRLYLEWAGYPQIGGGGIHLAHLLWGGLLMLVALVLLLATLGKRLKHVSAAVGGLGFGLFVDELGKFVTSDNNYFFQPAIAMIYLTLVVLFLLFRAIDKRNPSPMELLVNAADHVREVVLDGATHAEIARGLDLLNRSGARGPVVDHIRAVLQSAEFEPEGGPSRLRRFVTWVSGQYDRLVGWQWFQRVVWLVFVGQATIGVLAALALFAVAVVVWPAALPDLVSRENMQMLPGLGIGSVATSVLSLGLVTIGVARLRSTRLSAYRWFERSLLVAILVTQVMLFWQDQLAALGGLIWNLALLTVLRSMISLETVRLHHPAGE
jgi:hypothetical protein